MSDQIKTDEELAGMSDEEFLAYMNTPAGRASPPAPESEEVQEDVQEEETVDTVEEEEGTEEEVEEDGEAVSETDDDEEGEEEEEEKEAEDESEADSDEAGAEESPPGSDDDKESKEEEKDKKKDDTDLKPGDEGFDYKSAYEKLMAPFKANGKEVQLKSPEELIQLAQMGANYTQKMQALQPHLKVVRMLQNHGVLDEEKLSFLIDLEKRNPAAIQKLLKDADIDPMDIDTSVEPTYKPTDRRVSDDEWRFTSTLEEVASNPVGKQMIASINATWDRASKDALWTDPDIMRVLTTHKESGVYDQISSEIERRRILGQLQGVPFLQAYQAIGTEMQSQGILKPKVQATGENQGSYSSQKKPSQRVVKTGSVKRKSVSNDKKVKAATSPKSQPVKKTTPADFNPLALTDEEFEKQVALGNI